MNIYFLRLTVLLLIVLYRNIASSQSITWDKIYKGDKEENSTSSCQLTDGNFIMAGYIRDPGFKILLIKINQLGDTLWTKKIAATGDIIAYACASAPNNTFVITGEFDRDVYLMKLNGNGDSLWTKKYTDLHNQYANQVLADADGGYIIKGMDFVSKADSNGNKIWDKVDQTKEAIHVTKGVNGDIVSIYAYFDGNYRKLARKFSSVNGALLWEKNVDTLGIPRVITSKGNNYVVYGFNYGARPDSSSFYIATLDSNLIIKKNHSYTFYRYELMDDAFCLLPNDRYAFTTFSTKSQIVDTNILVMRIVNDNGQVLFQKEVLNKTSGDNVINTIIPLSNKDILFTGYYKKLFTGRNEEFYAIRTDSILNFTSTGISINNFATSYKIFEPYPNPFNPAATIKFELLKSAQVKLNVYNISGELIKVLLNERKSTGQHSVIFSGYGLPSGIYFLSFYMNNLFIATKKITLLK